MKSLVALALVLSATFSLCDCAFAQAPDQSPVSPNKPTKGGLPVTPLQNYDVLSTCLKLDAKQRDSKSYKKLGCGRILGIAKGDCEKLQSEAKNDVNQTQFQQKQCTAVLARKDG